jgi:hypothetical protein
MDEAPKPVGGTDYPATWSQFLEWFGNEAVCARNLERVRWPGGGFACTACGVVGEPYRASRGRLMCRACRHQGSVTAGTIFREDAHTAEGVVCRDLVSEQPQAPRERSGAAEGPRIGQPSDGLDDTASIASGDGAAEA